MTNPCSVRVSADLDICDSRTPESLRRLVTALEPLPARLRGAPPDLPFGWDVRTLRAYLNFTLDTDIGPIDLLGEVGGIGPCEAAVTASESIPLFDRPGAVLTLEALIRSKRAAGRPRDLESVIELEALRELRSRDTN